MNNLKRGYSNPETGVVSLKQITKSLYSPRRHEGHEVFLSSCPSCLRGYKITEWYEMSYRLFCNAAMRSSNGG